MRAGALRGVLLRSGPAAGGGGPWCGRGAREGGGLAVGGGIGVRASSLDGGPFSWRRCVSGGEAHDPEALGARLRRGSGGEKGEGEGRPNGADGKGPVIRNTVNTQSSDSAGMEHQGLSGETDFGRRRVAVGEKEGLVREVFDGVASRYDLMNDLMSGGLHRAWKRRLVERVAPFPGMVHLDCAGGTGDVAFRICEALAKGGETLGGSSAGTSPERIPGPALLRSEGGMALLAFRAAMDAAALAARTAASAGLVPPPRGGGIGRETPQGEEGTPPPDTRIVVGDINAAMLDVGKKRARRTGLAGAGGVLEWVECSAETLPFEDNTFDSYTISFGLRNVTTPRNAVAEALRVLRPGGQFLCMEFSRVREPSLRALYDWYSRAIIPEMGRVVAGDRDSYDYLVESIRKFPPQEELAQMLRDVGLKNVLVEDLSFGAVAIHSGFKL